MKTYCQRLICVFAASAFALLLLTMTDASVASAAPVDEPPPTLAAVKRHIFLLGG